jgi:glycosyltransferase involved in cell wall biosynthesis
MISVIVPNYNHSQFLKPRIESILSQTYTDFELIILDDASEDDSHLIIDEYRDHPKVSHVIINSHNNGSTFKQWKRGLDVAKGDWIWIAESDDLSDPKFLSSLIQKINLHPNINVIYCRSWRIDENDNSYGVHLWGEESDLLHWQNDFLNDGNREVVNHLWKRNFIPNASAVLFKKDKASSVIDTILPFKFSGDWYFWALMIHNSKIYFHAEVLNYFRRHSSAVSERPGREGIVERTKENMKVPSLLKKKYPDILMNPLSHKWIIKEWEARKKYLNIWEYYNPPFYFRLKLFFLKRAFYQLRLKINY